MSELSTLEVIDDPDELADHADEWDAVAAAGRNVFGTAEWYTAWWRTFGNRRTHCLLLRDRSGLLAAAGCFVRLPGNRLAGAANVETNFWDVVATGDGARGALLAQVAGLRFANLHLPVVPVETGASALTTAVLRDAGYDVREKEWGASPYLDLPSDFDTLLGSVSAQLRSTVGRRTRQLQREGTLTFRTTRGGDSLERDFREFLRIEASGWKHRAGTAIISDHRTYRLYADYLARAARAGSLRLQLLELDGRAIAADFGIAFARQHWLVKTGYDEDLGRFSPGLVLRAQVLRAAIEEGGERYEFGGMPDQYKLRWGAALRRKMTIDAYRGVSRTVPLFVAAAKTGRDLARRRMAQAARAGTARRPRSEAGAVQTAAGTTSIGWAT